MTIKFLIQQRYMLFEKRVYGTNHIVSYISNFMTLNPGDIITTGTPPGIGMARKPQIFLKDGDEMILEIDFLGFQKQKVILSN